MNGTRGHRIAALALISLVILLGATACEDSDYVWIREMAEEWGQSKNILPNNKDGSFNPMFAWNVGLRAAGASTGDEAADAALDILVVIQKIEAADRLAQEGFAESNLEKLNGAVAIRPGDYSYRNARGIVVLGSNATGQARDTALRDFADADALASARGPSIMEQNLKNRLDLFASNRQTGLNPTLREQGCKDAGTLYQLTGEDRLALWNCQRPATRGSPIVQPAGYPIATLVPGQAPAGVTPTPPRK